MLEGGFGDSRERNAWILRFAQDDKTKKVAYRLCFLLLTNGSTNDNSATTFHPFGNLMLAWYPVTLSTGEIFSGGRVPL